MDWPSENYVRLYTRDTTGWAVVPWQARATLPALLRKLDDAGELAMGDDGLEGLAALLLLPVDVVEPGIAAWVKRGTLVLQDGVLRMPKFTEAQTCSRSDSLRAKLYRERKAAEKADDSNETSRGRAQPTGHERKRPVSNKSDLQQTKQTDASHGVTSRHSHYAHYAHSPIPPNPPETKSGGGGSENQSAAPKKLPPEPVPPPVPRAGPGYLGTERQWFAEAVREATQNPAYVPPSPRDCAALLDVIHAGCPRADAKRAEAWLRAEVRAFVAATAAERQFYPIDKTSGLLRWISQKRPSAEQLAADRASRGSKWKPDEPMYRQPKLGGDRNVTDVSLEELGEHG